VKSHRASIAFLVLACAGCRAAYAQGTSNRDRVPRQNVPIAQQGGFDAGLGDAGRIDAGRNRDATVRDTGVDVQNDIERDTGSRSRDASRPPLTMPSWPADRPIGGGPNEAPQEPLPIDDAGRSPLR
jgi:hypothetical protein